jgi:hypothetical protein
LTRTHVEWVAHVSLLRPGFLGWGETICEEKPRSQKRDLGHPLNVWCNSIFDEGEHPQQEIRGTVVESVPFLTFPGVLTQTLLALKSVPCPTVPPPSVW